MIAIHHPDQPCRGDPASFRKEILELTGAVFATSVTALSGFMPDHKSNHKFYLNKAPGSQQNSRTHHRKLTSASTEATDPGPNPQFLD
jgi:hypothetical protein